MNVEIDINLNDYLARKVLGRFSEKIESLKKTASALNPFANFQRGLKKNIENVDSLESKLKQLVRSRNLSVDSSQIRILNQQIDQTQGKIDKLTNKRISPTIKTSGGLSGMSVVVGSSIGGALSSVLNSVTSAITDSLTGLVNKSLQAQSLNESIKFSGGIEGVKNLDFLTKTSDKYGFALNDMRVAYQKLSGSFMNTKLSGEPMRQIFDAISAAGRAMNMSSEQMQGSILALGQMMSKGKVSAEELRGQLGERLPGAFQLAARSMGVTTAQLDDMMSEGKVMSEDFLPKFAAELQRTFGAQAQNTTNALTAKIERLKNQITTLQFKAFEKVEPFLIRIVDFTNKVLANLSPIEGVLSDMSKSLEPLLIKLDAFLSGVSKGFMQKIASVIAGLIPLFNHVIDYGEKFANINIPFFGKMMNIFKSVKPVADIIGLVLDVASEITSFTTSVLTDFLDFSDMGIRLMGILEGVKSILKGLLNFVRTFFYIFKPIITAMIWLISKLVNAMLWVVDIIVNVLGKALDYFFKRFADRFNLIPQKFKVTTGLKASNSDSEIFGNDRGTGLADVFDRQGKNNKQDTTKIDRLSDSITSGGSKPTVFNISIGKFQDQVVIHAATFTEGVEKMQDALEEMFLRVTNGVSQAY